MNRSIFDAEHDEFRKSFAAWVAKELVPNFAEWERAGITPRDVFRSAGRFGFIGMDISETHGGGSNRDFRFNQVVGEELARAGLGGTGLGLTLHSDICTPYFVKYCDDAQAARWHPGIAAGELITAIAMTEPGAGSDLAGLATTAVRDGDRFIVDGSKTFITNGINADLVIVAARTDVSAGRNGISLLVVERGTPGFERGRKLEKIGLRSQDTAELFFDGAQVPAANLLGTEGAGFSYLTHNLAQERLSIAITGVAAARAALTWTVEYVRERRAFGTTVAAFQNTKFVLAGVKADIDVAQAYIDQCVLEHNRGELSAEAAAIAKLHATELQKDAVDRCLQLFGGYGYMLEYPIARAYTDARVTSIYGGTSEVMRTIIAKSLPL